VKTFFACLLSSAVAAVTISALAAVKNGISTETFGLMLIAFLYILVVSLVIGIPLHFALKKREAKSADYAGSGAITGAAFAVVPFVISGGSSRIRVEFVFGLALAGLLAGWTFYRTVKN